MTILNDVAQYHRYINKRSIIKPKNKRGIKLYELLSQHLRIDDVSSPSYLNESMLIKFKQQSGFKTHDMSYITKDLFEDYKIIIHGFRYDDEHKQMWMWLRPIFHLD